jgi:hypothetical protein
MWFMPTTTAVTTGIIMLRIFLITITTMMTMLKVHMSIMGAIMRLRTGVIVRQVGANLFSNRH